MPSSARPYAGGSGRSRLERGVGRLRLFTLYAAGLLADGAVSEATARLVADRTAGVTASFTKELVRRSVVQALGHDRAVRDDDVLAALEEMLSDAERLTRRLLGGGPGEPEWAAGVAVAQFDDEGADEGDDEGDDED